MQRDSPRLTDWFFRLLVDSVRDYAIFALDAQGRVASWNEGARRIKGYAADEVLGLPFSVFFIPDDIARGHPDELLRQAEREGRVQEEGWRVRKDGSRFWAEATVTALRGAGGELLGFAKLTRDLTRKRAAEQQARDLLREQVAREAAEAAVRRMRLLSEASSVLASSLRYEETLEEVAALAVPTLADFCALDLLQDGQPRRVAVRGVDPERERLARALGIDAGQAAAWHSAGLQHLPEIPAAAEGAGADDPLALYRALGLHAVVVAPLTAHGRLFGGITLGQASSGRAFDPADVTLIEELAKRAATAIENARLVADLESARRQLQSQATELEQQTADLRRLMGELAQKVNEAEAARAVAEEANRAKSRFLAAMSHELRTPLNAIAGHADLLALGVHGTLSDAQRGAISRIQRNQQRLLALIDDIIAFAKLEAGKLRALKQPVLVRELLADVEDLLARQAQDKGVAFEVLPAPPRLAVHADPDKAGRILVNLADNAVKFTDAGGRVQVGASADHDAVRIFFRDTGRGIPPEQLGTIFEPFVQVDQGHTREKEGLGLGLAISRELARNMDGDVTVESEPGHGSTFTLMLPRSRAAGRAA